MSIPSPDNPEPEYTATELVRLIRERGGRVHRYRAVQVFVLTNSEELQRWLTGDEIGGKLFTAPNDSTPPGSYQRARDSKPEWDVVITNAKVGGDIWEAAA